MSVVDDLRKLLQDLIAPELRAINAKLEAIELRIISAEKLADARYESLKVTIQSNHNAVMSALNVEKRLAIIEDRAQREKSEAQQ